MFKSLRTKVTTARQEFADRNKFNCTIWVYGNFNRMRSVVANGPRPHFNELVDTVWEVKLDFLPRIGDTIRTLPICGSDNFFGPFKVTEVEHSINKNEISITVVGGPYTFATVVKDVYSGNTESNWRQATEVERETFSTQVYSYIDNKVALGI